MKKEQDIWVGEFAGHKIKITNSGKARLYIDGIEAAKEKGLVHLQYELRAPIPDTEYIVIANVSGVKDSIITCDVMIAKKLDVVYGKELEDGTFTPYTEEDIEKMREEADEAAATTALLTTIL